MVTRLDFISLDATTVTENSNLGTVMDFSDAARAFSITKEQGAVTSLFTDLRHETAPCACCDASEKW